jgi:hypothetical protein
MYTVPVPDETFFKSKSVAQKEDVCSSICTCSNNFGGG